MPVSSIQLQELKSIDFTKTALSDIQQEIIDFIINHPQHGDNFDNFFESDSGRMLLDTFAYIVKKLIVRADLIANEAYPATAQQDSSIIKVLKLIGYELRSFTQGQVFINVAFPQGRPAAEVNLGTEFGLETTDLAGNPVTFYLRQDGPKDYFNPVKIPLDVDGEAKTGLILNGYSGELRIDNIDREDVITKDVEIYTLNETPVVQDSVRVFYQDELGGTVEATQVDSFFNIAADATFVGYVVHYDEFNGAFVEFGDSDLVEVLPDNKNLQIYYTIGGGGSHNVVENVLNISDSFVVPTITGNETVVIDFSNPGKGFGGKDPETVQEAKRTAPLSLRTINRCVTEEDYAILLARQGLVMHSQILSPDDNRLYFPADSEIPLFHVFIYVTINRTITQMSDLLLSKQVNNTGRLIGGDSFDILSFLKVRRIVGIENVLRPNVFTRLFFNITIEYNSFLDSETIEADARTEIETLYTIKNMGYGRTVRLNDIITKIKTNVTGVFDVKIDRFRVQSFNQVLDTVSSPLFFRFLDETPLLNEVKNDITELPENYTAIFSEVPFLLDSFNDVEIVMVALTDDTVS
jgi:hypothetical protein